jgi:hypothetical protein
MTRNYIALTVLLLAAGCSGGTPASPTPPANPQASPSPIAACCALGGMVTETSPTASTIVAGATVTVVAGLDTGLTTSSDGGGQYLFARLQLGALTVRTSAAGYDDTLQTLTLTNDRSGFGFQLNPTAASVFEQFNAVVSDQDPVCANYEVTTRLPCKSYVIALHSAGTVDAVLNWDDDIDMSSALALELVREPGTNQGDRIALNHVTQGNPNREQVIAAIPAGIYTVRVLYQRPLGPQPFILTMNHPR